MNPNKEHLKRAEGIAQICPNCKGDGFTAEHDPNSVDPDGQHNCCSCPVLAQCDLCHATGKIVDIDSVLKALSDLEEKTWDRAEGCKPDEAPHDECYRDGCVKCQSPHGYNKGIEDYKEAINKARKGEN